MTAATATAPTVPRQLVVYRDDGPLAGLLGRTLGAVLPGPAVAPTALAALVLALALLLAGTDASDGLAVAVIAVLVLAAGAGAGRPQTGRLAWATPPLLRFVEYGALIWLGALAGGSGGAAAFALLAAVSYRQYDLVYRLRHRAAVPPAWVGWVSGGWEGRLVAGAVLLMLGALPAVFFAAAAVLGVTFVGETVAGWMRQGDLPRPLIDDDDEEDDAG